MGTGELMRKRKAAMVITVASRAHENPHKGQHAQGNAPLPA